MLTERDDFPHVPHQWALMTWKENWCFTGVDIASGVGFVFHVSLRPQFGEGIFSVKLDGKVRGERVRLKSVERQPIGRNPCDLTEIASKRTRVEILESHRRFALTYDGDDGALTVMFTGRFQPFDFADGTLAPGPSTLGEIGRHVFPFHHYEQGLEFEAEFTPRSGTWSGTVIHLSGFGNRDHSWGWRDDFGFDFHHWVCANFVDRFVQGSVMQERSYAGIKFGGFIGTPRENVPVREVDVSSAYWGTATNQQLPALDKAVTYRLSDSNGNVHVITAQLDRAVARNFLNARHENGQIVYEDCQVFCPYLDETSGESGAGILEIGKMFVHPDAAAMTRHS